MCRCATIEIVKEIDTELHEISIKDKVNTNVMTGRKEFISYRGEIVKRSIQDEKNIIGVIFR